MGASHPTHTSPGIVYIQGQFEVQVSFPPIFIGDYFGASELFTRPPATLYIDTLVFFDDQYSVMLNLCVWVGVVVGHL